MQKSQETAAETETERERGLRLIGQRSIVQLQFLERVSEILILRGVRGIKAAVHHGCDLLIARERLRRRVLYVRHRVTDLRVPHILDARGEVAYHAGRELIAGDKASRRKVADFDHIHLRAGRHHANAIALSNRAVLHAEKDNDALIAVVERVENEGLQRLRRIAARRRELLHNGLQDLVHIETGLCGNARRGLCLDADYIFDFQSDLVWLRARKIHLIDDRDNLEVVVQRHVDICERLRLNALGGIDHKNRTVAGCERTGNFIIKVHVSRCVDQVKNILLAVCRAVHRARCLALDCDAALPLEIHGIQNLVLHLPLGEQTRLLDDAVRERGFTVVDVRDDTKVSDMFSVVSRHASSIKTFGRLRLRCRNDLKKE